MFPYAMGYLKEGQSRTRVLGLSLIIALLVLLLLPSGSVLARSHAARQSVQPSRALVPATSVPLKRGIEAISYNNSLYDFVLGIDGHLWADVWNGYNLHWDGPGLPFRGH